MSLRQRLLLLGELLCLVLATPFILAAFPLILAADWFTDRRASS